MDADTSRLRAGQLDGIRALCVLAVIFSHTIPETYRIGDYSFYEFGSYGVYMFFILSGFLITGQLLATRDDLPANGGIGGALRIFYAKRVLRLFPAYYLAVFGAVILNMPGMRAELPWHVAQLSDILFALDPEIENGSVAGHFWSLTVEWQFYLVWPLAILLAPSRALPWLIAGMLAVSVYSWAPLYDLDPVVERTNILQSIDSLAFGAGLAWAAHRGWRLDWLGRAAWPAAAMCLIGAGAYMAGDVALGEALTMPAHEAMNLLFTAIIWRAATGFGGAAGAVLDAAPVTYVGRISYGIYVYHGFILANMDRLNGRLGRGELEYGFGLTIILFVAATATAALSWRYMEQPINRLRHRLTPGGAAISGEATHPA